jgi:hypothetical protein
MLRRILATACALLLPVLVTADEPVPNPVPVPPGAPPAGPGGPPGDALPAEAAKPVDPLLYLAQVKALLQEHEVVPPRTETNHALYDAWQSILKSRAPRMTARVKNVMERRRWVFDPAAGTALHLDPGHWGEVIGDLGALYTELGGALGQYLHVQVNVTQTRPLHDPHPYVGPVAGQFALAALEKDFVKKLLTGQVIWATEVATYWSILGRVQTELALQAQRVAEWEARQERRREQLESMLADIAGGLQNKQQMLALQMLSVRMLAAALQVREEDRLRDAAGCAKEGTALCAQLQGVLNAMRVTRLTAESHVDPPVSEYGTLLRRWLRSRTEAEGLLRKAEEAAKAGG